MAVNNPIAYYKKMGILNPTSLVYSAALIAACGGLVGIGLGVVKGQPWIPYVGLTIGGAWAAVAGINQANEE
jgi:hypothetical protein